MFCIEVVNQLRCVFHKQLAGIHAQHVGVHRFLCSHLTNSLAPCPLQVHALHALLALLALLHAPYLRFLKLLKATK